MGIVVAVRDKINRLVIQKDTFWAYKYKIYLKKSTDTFIGSQLLLLILLIQTFRDGEMIKAISDTDTLLVVIQGGFISTFIYVLIECGAKKKKHSPSCVTQKL